MHSTTYPVSVTYTYGSVNLDTREQFVYDPIPGKLCEMRYNHSANVMVDFILWLEWKDRPKCVARVLHRK